MENVNVKHYRVTYSTELIDCPVYSVEYTSLDSAIKLFRKLLSDGNRYVNITYIG